MSMSEFDHDPVTRHSHEEAILEAERHHKRTLFNFRNAMRKVSGHEPHPVPYDLQTPQERFDNLPESEQQALIVAAHVPLAAGQLALSEVAAPVVAAPEFVSHSQAA